jgi:phosphatidylglycerol:prolipoprotein diacylglycerol transferase
MPTIHFPNLNLSFSIDPVAFTIFGVPIYWYGMIITTGILLGLLTAVQIGKKEGLTSDDVFDFLLIDLVFAIIGARLYFVFGSLEYYLANPIEIFNLRKGGIGIYGAIIASVIVAIVYTKKKKINFWKFADVATFGLLVGQIIGRYGNFVNKEAFGDYTNSFFAMQLLKSEVNAPLTTKILENTVIMQGLEYIQVHPTFFYESTWNILLVLLLLGYRKYKKIHGEIFCLYVAGYGLGRFWIEGLRTDQLILPILGIPSSQVVAALSVIGGISAFIWCRKTRSRSL